MAMHAMDKARRLFRRAYKELLAGNWPSARVYFEKGLALSAQDGTAWLGYVGLLYELGEDRLAIGAAEKALVLPATTSRSEKELLYHFKGMSHERLGERASAEDAYRRALEVKELADTWFHLEEVLEADRPLEKALCLERALELDPRHAEAHSRLAIQCDEHGNYVEAERHLRLAVAAQPKDGRFKALLGGLLAQHRRYREALAYLRPAVKQLPRCGQTRLCLADALTELGHFAE